MTGRADTPALLDFPTCSGRQAVNISGRDALMHEIGTRFAARRGFALATLNLDHLVKLAHDPAFCAAYAAQDLVVADGNPIVWFSRLAGRPVTLVPGADLVVPLAEMAAANGCNVALVGSTGPALDSAARTLERLVPGIRIRARIAPPMDFTPGGAEARRILGRMHADDIGLCLIALGAPKQEMLAARGRTIAPQTGFASIGAGLDFLAGQQQRAPEWVRKLALEWIWRMLTAPRRLAPRYARCAAIMPRLARDALRQRRTALARTA